MSFKKPFRAVPVKLGPHYRAKQRRQAAARRGQEAKFLLMVASLSTVVFIWVWSLDDEVPVSPTAAAAESEPSVYYSGCREARAAGAAPIYEGQPGYRPEVDGDGDGIACEPYRGL